MMTPNQVHQKERARLEAEMHIRHSAVDRLREAHMDERIAHDKGDFREDLMRTKKVRDANNAYAGEE